MKIPIKFSREVNVSKMASDVIRKCEYLHPSRAEEIEQLVIKLRRHYEASLQDNRNVDQRGADKGSRGTTSKQAEGNASKSRQGAAGGYLQADERPNNEYEDDAPAARLEDLEEYLDLLYQVSGKKEKEKEDGLNAQIKGTKYILQLCRDVMNLEQLIQNNTVMGALTRVFQEEYKKSIEFTFNILRYDEEMS